MPGLHVEDEYPLPRTNTPYFTFYRWSFEFGSANRDGTVFTELIAGLNAQALAGYTDWRLPELAELQELRELGRAGINGVIPLPFLSGCAPGCDATACDCTAQQKYWTDTRGPDLIAGDTAIPQVETVDFGAGAPAGSSPLLTKGSAAARAVRGP